MSKNYAALAQQIVAAIGGVDNVAAVTHCMTRLRFVVFHHEADRKITRLNFSHLQKPRLPSSP